MTNPTATTPMLHRVEAACELLSVGRSTLYALIAAGQIRSVKIGKSRLIPESAIREFVAALEAEAAVPEAV